MPLVGPNGNDHLAEVFCGSQVLKRLNCVFELEHFVADRMNPVGRERPVEVSKLLNTIRETADENASKAGVFRHERMRGEVIARRRQHADQRDFTAWSNRTITMRQSAKAPDFDYMIRATSVSQIEDGSGPVARRRVIYAIVRSQ